MKLIPQAIPEVVLIEGPVFQDDRGAFLEAWREDQFAANELPTNWKQENISSSRFVGTVRGLHWQIAPYAQAKLIRVLTGRVFDVVVDLRKGSSTYLQRVEVELSASKNQQLLVPVGFAHGFCTLELNSSVLYKTSTFYAPSHERSLLWNDPKFAISWPVDHEKAILSAKDAAAPVFSSLTQSDVDF